MNCKINQKPKFYSVELSELEWVDHNDILGSNDVLSNWTNWLSLGGDLSSFFLSLFLEFIVGLNSLDESDSAL